MKSLLYLMQHPEGTFPKPIHRLLKSIEQRQLSTSPRRKERGPNGDVSLTLFDPRRDAAFLLERICKTEQFSNPQRSNYFTILWIQEGHGTFHADLAEYSFAAPALLFFNPYQTFFLVPESPLRGVRLQFHANFFCIETHHEAVGCNGVLFNDIYGQPQVSLSDPPDTAFKELILQMERELQVAGLAHTEMLVSYLKVFLIKATRLKLEQQDLLGISPAGDKPPVLERLAELIELHYRNRHAPGEYAALLNMTPKALGKLVKVHFGKTLTDLIRERVLKHAKWQLLHTRRSVKEIAGEVGFDDEFYFSRLFKRATGTSPTVFREFETAIRSGGNLSM